jgi:ankyrin repeat protein
MRAHILEPSLPLHLQEFVASFFSSGDRDNSEATTRALLSELTSRRPNAARILALLKRGADPSGCDEERNTVLHLATALGDSEIVKELLKGDKVDVNAVNKVRLRACKTEVGLSDASRAFAGPARQLTTFRSLYLFVQDGFTALHLAGIGGHTQICHALIGAGAQVDFSKNVSVKCGKLRHADPFRPALVLTLLHFISPTCRTRSALHSCKHAKHCS